MSQISHTFDQENPNTNISKSRSPFRFFLLVFALSIPFWLIGSLTTLQILPGLPVSSLAIIIPTIAASMLVYREDKIAGVFGLLKRSFDFKRIRVKLWYVPIFLLMPGVMVLSFGMMRLIGTPVPPPQISVLSALAMFLTFFVAGLGEEIGWMGYAIEPLQARYNALLASILLGLVWATWHVTPLLQADRSSVWIAWWFLTTVAQRVLIVWIYNNSGKSIFAAAVTHAVMNLSWQLFPINGSYYDPQITGLITAFVALIVTIIWGPGTLTRSRSTSESLGTSDA